MKTIMLQFTALFLLLSSSLDAQMYFPPNNSNDWETIDPESLNWCPEKIDNLYQLLETNDTKAFLILKDGKIVLEKYFGDHAQSTPWYWASAGKTVTSFLVGIAQQENALSIADTSSDYLGEGWTDCTPDQEAAISVRNQLTMTSGLDDGTGDPHCTLDTCLIYKADADTRWAYHNGPYTLLDGVIENATGLTLNQYATQKLKTPTGMTGNFVPVEYNNVFFSTARSMARFGLLILNEGNWNGTAVMTDTNYFNEMVTTSQNLNKSYGYLWWLNGKESYMIPSTQVVLPGSFALNAPADMIGALGKNGQFLNVVPSENIVLVRMGNSPDESLVPFLFNDEIWTYVNDLTCAPVSVNEKEEELALKIFPNPSNATFAIEIPQSLDLEEVNISVYNMQGKLIDQIKPNKYQIEWDGASNPKGVYLLTISGSKKIRTVKLIKG